MNVMDVLEDARQKVYVNTGNSNIAVYCSDRETREELMRLIFKSMSGRLIVSNVKLKDQSICEINGMPVLIYPFLEKETILVTTCHIGTI